MAIGRSVPRKNPSAVSSPEVRKRRIRPSEVAARSVKAIVSSSARPINSTIASATRLCLAKLRPGTPNTFSSAEKSEAKMRREVQASRIRPGPRNLRACSMNERSASSDGASRWTTTPRTRSRLPW